MSSLTLEPWRTQADRWPGAGRHVLAQFDAGSVVVYQAYRPAIGRWAAEHGHLGGPDFSLGRMSWIKPNFCWMMFRSGWGTKEGQEITLALRITRAAFDALLAAAVPSSFGAVPGRWANPEAWKAAVAGSDVRLQWDPDHHPSGAPLERRALQLGLRGEALARFAREWIVSLEDVSELVAEQRVHAQARAWDRLVTPREEVYPVAPALAASLGLPPST